MKNKNIFVLPTDKPSRLYINSNRNLVITKLDYGYPPCRNVNIYITSYNEEIKEVDWYYLPKENKIAKCPKMLNLRSVTPEWTQKIILTTDQDLIADGVQAIPDEFLEWFVKNPSCEWVEVGKIKNYKGNYFDCFHRQGQCDCGLSSCKQMFFTYKIIIPKTTQEIIDEDFAGGQIIPKEEPKQETLEEAAERIYQEDFNTPYLEEVRRKNIKDAMIKLANWQAERMYSEKEVQANAILISKAPEMLEMLKIILQSENTPIVHRKKVKQLIKEATEI